MFYPKNGSLFLIAFFMMLQSCGEHNTHTNQGVVWAELRVMDELSEKALRAGNESENDLFQETMSELNSAVRRVSESDPPENAKNKEQVKVLQTDLQGLIVEDVKALSSDELIERANAVHSITVKLMEAAGVPHVHDDEHDHEDHTGHNH